MGKSLEQSLRQLEDVLQALENSDMPIDEAINRYAEGMTLAVECRKTLSELTEKVNEVRQKSMQEIDEYNRREEAKRQSQGQVQGQVQAQTPNVMPNVMSSMMPNQGQVATPMPMHGVNGEITLTEPLDPQVRPNGSPAPQEFVPHATRPLTNEQF